MFLTNVIISGRLKQIKRTIFFRHLYQFGFFAHHNRIIYNSSFRVNSFSQQNKSTAEMLDYLKYFRWISCYCYIICTELRGIINTEFHAKIERKKGTLCYSSDLS